MMTLFLMASITQVTARSEARAVGMLAFRKAAWERQREESMLQSRRKLASELSSMTDPEQAAVLLAKPLSTRFAGLYASAVNRTVFTMSGLSLHCHRAGLFLQHGSRSQKQSEDSHVPCMRLAVDSGLKLSIAIK